jgi:ribonuclease HI
MEMQPKYMLNTSHQTKPTGDMLLVEIGNQTGFEQYSTARTDHAHTAFLAAVLQALNSSLPEPARINAAAVRTYCSSAHAILDNNSTPQQRIRAAAKVRKLPADTSMRICNTFTATPLPPKYATAQLPLKYNWRHLAYTDGSYIDPKRTANEEATLASQPPASPDPAADTNSQPAELEQCEKVPRIGAAVYIPPQQPNSNTGEKEVACLPSNEEYPYDDTINRAELAAAWKAITMRCTQIATDSLAALYQIHKVVTKPHDIRLGFHRHAAMLQQIASSIASSRQPIHIYKVKSHIDIPGNEHADEIATSVAKGIREADETIATPSNNRPSMAWPHHPEVWESGKAAPTPPRPVKDIPALHRMAHRCHKLGSSNTAAICFAAAQAIAHDVEKVSYAFLTSTVVPYREVVNALKVMTGTFYSQKRAWWYGRASSDKCVLCGQPDGTLHAVSGCPQLTLAVTKRHNDAVLLLAKAILTGENGSQVVAMDIATETQQAEGIQVMSQFKDPATRDACRRTGRPG